MHVARSKRTAFEVAVLIEHEERVIAGAAEMTIPYALLLLAMGWADAGVHVEDDLIVCAVRANAVGQRRIVQRERAGFLALQAIAFRIGPSGSVRRHGLLLPCRRLSSASPDRDEALGIVHVLVAARRPKTDWRSMPTNARRPFLPVRASAIASPARSLKPSASSSSRYASKPHRT
jgi:hypothetical protein